MVRYYGDMPTPSRNRSAPGRSGRWPVGIVCRFHTRNMFQTSAALWRFNADGAVPLVTVVLALAGALPFLDVLLSRLDFSFARRC